MGFSKSYKNEIINFILESIEIRKNPFSETINKYNVSRQTISKYLKELLKQGFIQLDENKKYFLSMYNQFSKEFDNIDLKEDQIYNENILKFTKNLPQNISSILEYCFTEMLNNAIDHSNGKKIKILYTETYFHIIFLINDNGVGIFKKIMKHHNFESENQAIFELKKGKLTSDAENHSGEGIFFTSKVADFFQIKSYNNVFLAGEKFPQVFGKDNKTIKGTEVFVFIDKRSNRTTQEIFDKYTSENYEFDKTDIVIQLAKEFMNNRFVSRSEAKRIMLNTEKFNRILLDFDNIDTIGQGFADEIFRVWKNKNPEREVLYINASPNVEFMIKRINK